MPPLVGMSVKAVVFAFLLMPFAQMPVSAQEDQPVRVCHGNGGYPPIHYYPEGVTDGPMVGSTIDILNEIFRDRAGGVLIEALPWKRCYASALNPGGHSIIADGSYNEKRTEYFYYSEELYSLTPAIFVKEGGPLADLSVKSTNDVKKMGYSLCANRGTNLAAYGLTVDDLAIEITSVDQGLTLVSLGRCDAYIQLKEIAEGFYYLDREKGKIPRDIVYSRLEDVPPFSLHLLISKTSPNAIELFTDISQRLVAMRHDGVTDRLIEAYSFPMASTN
ncbi:substrate-binding periplasmic protein [Rhodovibrionaceae bacterium A322]